MTPVPHLELWISPRIFGKNWNGPNGILRVLRETDSWKNPEVKKYCGTVHLIHTFKVIEIRAKNDIKKKIQNTRYVKHTYSSIQYSMLSIGRPNCKKKIPIALFPYIAYPLLQNKILEREHKIDRYTSLSYLKICNALWPKALVLVQLIG
jgi:hypothetical protein